MIFFPTEIMSWNALINSIWKYFLPISVVPCLYRGSLLLWLSSLQRSIRQKYWREMKNLHPALWAAKRAACSQIFRPWKIWDEFWKSHHELSNLLQSPSLQVCIWEFLKAEGRNVKFFLMPVAFHHGITGTQIFTCQSLLLSGRVERDWAYMLRRA